MRTYEQIIKEEPDTNFWVDGIVQLNLESYIRYIIAYRKSKPNVYIATSNKNSGIKINIDNLWLELGGKIESI